MKVSLTIRSFGGEDSEARAILANAGLEIWENRTGKHLPKDELIAAIRDAEGVIAGTEKFDREVLSSAPRLRVISRVGVGIDNIDAESSREQHILVKNTPLTPAKAVAEHTFALIFALYRRLKEHFHNLTSEQFKALSGYLLDGKTIGICGLGNVGRKVAAIALAFGCKVMFYDPREDNEPADACLIRVGSLKELFSQSDIVTIHASHSPKTQLMVNREVLTGAKSNLLLINTARGSMIDENALLEYLDNGRLMGAGLDVFQNEPYKGPLANHPKVVATPHVASNTIETRKAMELEAVYNLLEGLKS